MTNTCSPNTSPHINEEREDIFAIRMEHKNKEMVSVDTSKLVTEGTKESGSEMTAAAALPIPVGSPTSFPINKTDKILEEEKEFEIPQILTKSGRKRAVPFTLKVRTS
jgi:hypothetical protein